MTFLPALETIPEHESMILTREYSDILSELPTPQVNPRRSIFSMWTCSHPECIAYPYSKKAIFCRGVQRPLWTLITILGIINILTVAWQCIFYLLLSEGLLVLHKNPSGLPNWSTQDITPIRCHSHNDYRRHVPLHSALRTGCISVEVSVWPWENEVLVGDSRYTVLQGTLQSVYLDPLKNLLDRNNAPSHDWQELGNQDMVGLFSSDTKQTFALMLDFKHDGDQIWSILLEHLHPFREKGYLTYFNGSDVTYGPITVVASGAVPSHRILENTTYRDVFYDAPLNNLTFPAEIAKDYGAHPMDKFYSPSNSYYASADLQKEIGPLSLNRLSDFQLDTIRNQVQAAHKLGLKVRYSGIPTKPTGLRSHIWHVLVHEGVDVIDIDDLRGVTKLDWRARRWWKG